MLLGIIRDKTNNIEYHVDSETKDNYTELSITRVDNDTIRLLSKEEFLNLLQTIFSSKLTYKEKYKDYDVYYDEANNRRYFKNGKEDLLMFIENNGFDAVNYYEKSSTKPKSKLINVFASTIAFDIIISSLALIPFAGDSQLRQKVDTIASSVISLSSDEIINSIRKSNRLSEKDKELLCNKEYFDFMLQYTDSIRNYSLRKRFDNIGIKTFSNEDVPNANGYYNALDPNTIYILDEDYESGNYEDILIHEFIHTTQNQSSMYYVIEASDELIKSEFWHKPIIAYPECVKRVKILTEILGPEVIADCNYSFKREEFTKALREYLSPEDANNLATLFCTPSTKINDPNFDSESVHKEIDKYLAKIYYNKTGKDINDDIMIKLIYSNSDAGRLYFNYYSDDYYKDHFLFTDKELIGEYDMKDVIHSDEVEQYEYLTSVRKEVDGRIVTNSVRNITTDISKIPRNESKTVIVKYKDDTVGYVQFDKDKGWDKLKRYKFIEKYEPSISRKFPIQAANVYNKYHTEFEKLTEEAENQKSEAKSI